MRNNAACDLLSVRRMKSVFFGWLTVNYYLNIPSSSNEILAKMPKEKSCFGQNAQTWVFWPKQIVFGHFGQNDLHFGHSRQSKLPSWSIGRHQITLALAPVCIELHDGTGILRRFWSCPDGVQGKSMRRTRTRTA